MNTLLEQLVIQELTRLVTGGEVDNVIETLVSYLERAAPDIGKLWEAAIADIASAKKTTTSAS